MPTLKHFAVDEDNRRPSPPAAARSPDAVGEEADLSHLRRELKDPTEARPTSFSSPLHVLPEVLPQSWIEARAASSVIARAIDLLGGQFSDADDCDCGCDGDDDDDDDDDESLSSVTSIDCSDGSSWGGGSNCMPSSDDNSSDEDSLVLEPETKVKTAAAKKRGLGRGVFNWSDDDESLSEGSNWSEDDGPKNKRPRKSKKAPATSTPAKGAKPTKSKPKAAAAASSAKATAKKSTANGFALGTNVVLQNLVRGMQYNGKLGVIASLVRKGRQDVRIPSMGKTTVSIKIENIRAAASLFKVGNNGASSADASRGPFPIGARVILQKLVGGAQFNGKYGIVRSLLRGGRQSVEVLGLGGKQVSVKSENMRPNKQAGK